jgi:hypothetical protein
MRIANSTGSPRAARVGLEPPVNATAAALVRSGEPAAGERRR